MEEVVEEKLDSSSEPPNFQLVLKELQENKVENLTQIMFSNYFINTYKLDLVGRLNQLKVLEYCIKNHFLVTLQNNQEIFIILSKIIFTNQYSIIISKCYEIISILLPISEIYASSALFTVILDRYKPLFPNKPVLQINSNAIEYPYIGLFIRGIEHESSDVRINALKCIKTHCLKYESLFSKIIQYLLDLLNDLTKDVQLFSMKFLIQILKEKSDKLFKHNSNLSFAFSFINHRDKELQYISMFILNRMMAFKLYSYYIVRNREELMIIFIQLCKLEHINNKYKLYKYIYKFSVNNQKMCRELTPFFIKYLKGSYDVYINRLISSLLAGCESITNNNQINLMIREHWLNFMSITKSILTPFTDIYKGFNFPKTLTVNNLGNLYSCYKQAIRLDIYKFTALHKYFNIMIKTLNIFHLINQLLPNEKKRVEISSSICEIIVEVILLLSQYIKLSDNFKKQLLHLLYDLIILHNSMPNVKKTILLYEITKSVVNIFEIDTNCPSIDCIKPKEITEFILKTFDFSFVDYYGISNRAINNLRLSVKELTYVTFNFNSKYPLDVTIVYENKYLLKYNCLIHIFTSDNQFNIVDILNTMDLTKIEIPLYITMKRTEGIVRVTLNLIPDFPQSIKNLSNFDDFKIFSCSYLIKPD